MARVGTRAGRGNRPAGTPSPGIVSAYREGKPDHIGDQGGCSDQGYRKLRFGRFADVPIIDHPVQPRLHLFEPHAEGVLSRHTQATERPTQKREGDRREIKRADRTDDDLAGNTPFPSAAAATDPSKPAVGSSPFPVVSISQMFP